MTRPGCGWGGGSSAPEAANYRTVDLMPMDFAMNPVRGQDNPPHVVEYPLQASWFAPAIEFPECSEGGSWCQASFMTCPYADPADLPFITFSWASDGGPLPPQTIGVDVQITANADGSAIAGGGPGVTITDTYSGPNIIRMPPIELQIPITGGGAWGPDQLINVNLYRCAPADTLNAFLYLFAVRIRYKVL